MKLKQILALSFASLTLSASAFAMNWNQYDESKDYATSSMHQGYYTVEYLPSVSIDLYAPPVYALSVNQYNVENNGAVVNAGRATYLLNYNTKEVKMLDLKNPSQPWLALPTVNNPQQLKNIDKLFEKAYGMKFFQNAK